MKFFRIYLSAVLLLFCLAIFFTLQARAATPASGGISWQTWTEDLFNRAKREKRFVLLDLKAVWCHWCHVMDQKTYSDPKVQSILQAHFLAVKVDQDSRPDLSQRYQEYGWPATVVYSPQGGELIKRAGFIPPEEMAELLQAIVSDPRSGQKRTTPSKISAAPEGNLSHALRQTLIQRYQEAWDEREGGLALMQKFLDDDTVEYALFQAGRGEAREAERARRYLEANLALSDPEWGGFYQYSTHGNWLNPHFEKIMSFQAKNLKAYAQAYLYFGEEKFLLAAEGVHRYLKSFLLSPEGALYTSQDADLIPGQHSEAYFALSDGERRKQGVPKVDRHRYARENGWAIEGLVHLYMASGNPRALEDGRRAANWVLANRPLAKTPFQIAQYLAREKKSPIGGYRHDEQDAAGPYLGDSLAMARAFLALYTATAERSWLARAEESARFIQANFSLSQTHGSGGGFFAAVEQGEFPPVLNIDENLAAARFFNRLSHYTGNSSYRESVREAMRYLGTQAVATERISEPGILLVDRELRVNPLHVTVVGSKNDPGALALFQAALRFPASYKRVEWLDKSEGVLPNPEVQYPDMKSAAAFVCTNKLCSSPVYQPEQLAPLVAKLANQADPQP